MRTQKLPAVLLVLAALAACAPASAPVKNHRAAPAPKAPAEAPKLSPADQTAVDQLYYQAVSAYTRDDLKAAGLLLSEIFKLAPAYAPAKELQEKIRLAAEQR